MNKVDNEMRERNVAEFTELGLENVFLSRRSTVMVSPRFSMSATESFAASVAEEVSSGRPASPLFGRPNVGKSSLINSIFKGERTIVSEIPGTTRDSIDVPFTHQDKPYMLIDTAGLRHRRKIKSSVDQFGLMRAERSIRECDVAVLVLDAVDGVTKQDKNIAGQIFEAGRGCVILVNKWDLAAEEERKEEEWSRSRRKKKKTFREEYLEALRKELFFLDWASVLFVSAKTGQAVNDLFGEIELIEQEMKKRVDTPQLNKLLIRALESYPAPYVHGKRFRIYYAFQKSSRPPTLMLFCNDKSCLTEHYRRFLIDKIRAAWGFTGWPVLLELRQKIARELTREKNRQR